MTDDARTRGHIEFSASTPAGFVDLVRQTLEESASITTEWAPDVYPGVDVLTIKEVQRDE